MEFYLLLSFFVIYFITSFAVNKRVLNKIWTVAFIASFAITGIAIGFIRVSQQDVMMSAGQLNWYYMLYLFGSMAVVLGVLNLWMYRKALWNILFRDSDTDIEEDEDNE